LRRTTLHGALLCAAALAATASPALAADTGGTTVGPENNGTVQGDVPSGGFSPGEFAGGMTPSAPDTVGPAPQTAHVATLSHGVAQAPVGAPAAVRAAIAAANRIRHKPYVWGGGHAAFRARGYDCSGSVSYVLHAAGLLGFPEISGALAHWGLPGSGRWITVYANAGHAFMIIAGLRFDTSGEGASGPRWRAEPRWLRGFHRRHPAGL
jgi:cell wall-associated NlpC family hydrolase